MKILGTILGIIISINIIFQFKAWYDFKNAGPRFTAQDGQELCIRIKRLEEVSYGFKEKQIPILECSYGAHKP